MSTFRSIGMDTLPAWLYSKICIHTT